MKNPTVSIVVLNYNGLEYLKKCLLSINKQTYKYIEVIITDNHSTDGSVEYVKKKRGVKIVSHDKNYGYAQANNIGAKYAAGEFIFFLNNDTELLPDCISQLVKCYKPRSILSPNQLRPWKKNDEGRAHTGMDIFGYPYGVEDAQSTKPFYADGAAIFLKRKDFFKIGMFDPELFIFQEDIDFSWRALIQGYKVIPCWDAKLLHYGGATVLGGVVKGATYQSSYFRRYLNEKNVLRNIIKNYSFPLNFLLLFILMFFHIAEIIVLAILGRFRVIQCYLDAYKWNISHYFDTLSFRRKVQAGRKVSDLEIMKKMYWSYSKIVAFKNLGIPEFK